MFYVDERIFKNTSKFFFFFFIKKMSINLHLLTVEPSKIRNAGLGCFAAVFIPAGTIIGPYKGKYMTLRQRNDIMNGAYIWKINENRFVDAIDHIKNNPLRYVNGTKTPLQKNRTNCAVKFLGPTNKERVYYMTIKDIKKGEELLVSYGNNYFLK
jgi:SET domain-containing protein